MIDPSRGEGAEDGAAPSRSSRRARDGVTSRLLDETRHVRRLALGALAMDSLDALFALRSVAVRDEDAEVRAAAVSRLRDLHPHTLATGRAAVGEALADALRDESPLVREAAARAAKTLHEPRAEEPLRAAIRLDPAWQTRRAAVRALAAIAGERSAADLLGALDDPFWRVRHAAVQALAAWPDVPLPTHTNSARSAAALEYIARIRRGELGAALEPPGSRESPGPREPALVEPDPPEPREPALVEPDPPEQTGPLADEDPAVVAARLTAAPADLADSRLLIASLASPHDSLRRAAVRALAARDRPQELLATLAWLDDPRAPYAGDATRRLLRRVNATPLCEQILADASATSSPGALAWALDLAARDSRRPVPRATPETVSTAAGRALAHPAPIVRRAALHALASLDDEDAVLRALEDPDEATRADAVAALEPAFSNPTIRSALDKLLADTGLPATNTGLPATNTGLPATDTGLPATNTGLPATNTGLPATDTGLPATDTGLPATNTGLPATNTGLFVARALLGALRVGLGRDIDPAMSTWIAATLERVSRAPWADVRADALSLRARRGELPPDELARLCQDPDPWIREAALDPERAALALAEDPDPFVRRAAARAALGRALPPALRAEAAARAALSTDPWIRAKAAGALDTRSDAGLAAALRLTRDPTPMVRAAATDALSRTSAVAPRCLRLARHPGTPDDLRLAAHARLAATPTPESFAALTADVTSPALPPTVRETLRAIALVYPETQQALSSAPETATLPAAPAPPETATLPAAPAPPETATLPAAPAPPETATLPAAPPSPSPPPPPTTALSISPPRAAPPSPPSPAGLRPLGNTGLLVSPLGLSGAGELPPACFAEARAAGVNLFFWEPGHRSLGAFLPRAPRRHDLVIVTGSYEADRRSIERDVDRALTRLRIDTLPLMLLFWVRSPARLDEGAHDTLLRLKQQGKIRAIGLSTHLRDLATQAIAARPWDVVMCRLSAAHPGAERALLPAAAARGVGILAFSALSYGRLLDPRADPPITAPDCYRYTLSQPGVSACLSAPRRWRELAENLPVLDHPTLPPEDLARLRAHGARIHAANRTFGALVHKA